MSTVRVMIADDHTILREGLVALINASDDCRVVAEAADGVAAVDAAMRTRPDVAVIDLSMPLMAGIEVVRRLTAALPATRILVLTMHTEEEYVLHLVRAGAAGYMLKDSATGDLLAAIRALAGGRGYFGPHAASVLARQVQQPGAALDDPYRGLTPREREVFHLMAEGMTTKEIARRLEIETKTAENHRTRVLDKIGVRNTAELIRYAVRHGLLAR
jgi:two-component system, NarL family, response regulator NreC